MVGWLKILDTWFWPPQTGLVRVGGAPLLSVSLPRGDPDRRLRQGAALLRKRGVRRALLSPPLDGAGAARYGLVPVDPLPLCRAMAVPLTLELVKGVPRRERRVALRGAWAGEALELADALCPQVGALLLDFDRGEETLAGALRFRRGTEPLRWGQASPQVSVELAPRKERTGRTLKLWGEPDLCGLELVPDGPLPAGPPALPLLTLLWETGRLDLGAVSVRSIS